MNIQIRPCGNTYRIHDLNGDQRQVLGYILREIKRYIEDPKSFKPIRMKVIGKAGSGKSFVINTLVSVVRKMFQSNTICHVVAPTGVSAFNAGGSTIHHTFHTFKGNMEDQDISDNILKKMKPLFQDTMVLMFDKKQMIETKLFGRAKLVTNKVAHGGRGNNSDWGGIPIVVLFGDDYQLRPIRRSAFDIPLPFPFKNTDLSTNELIGQHEFLNFAQNIMELTQVERHNENEKSFSSLLKKVRDDRLTSEDVYQGLARLHIQHGNLSQTQRKIIEDNALYVFTTHEEKNRHNIKSLQQKSSSDNPIAKIEVKQQGKANDGKGVYAHFKEYTNLTTLTLCKNTQVKLQGKNLKPSWGLFNGSIGKVIDIIFQQNANPNHGQHPDFIVVQFPLYIGPSWDPLYPKVCTNSYSKFNTSLSNTMFSACSHSCYKSSM